MICVFGLKKGILREETKEITHPPETQMSVVSDGVKIKKNTTISNKQGLLKQHLFLNIY